MFPRFEVHPPRDEQVESDKVRQIAAAPYGDPVNALSTSRSGCRTVLGDRLLSVLRRLAQQRASKAYFARLASDGE